MPWHLWMLRATCQLETDLSATVYNPLDFDSHFVDVIETRSIPYSLNVNWTGIRNGEAADCVKRMPDGRHLDINSWL